MSAPPPRQVSVEVDLLIAVARALYRRGDDHLRQQVEALIEDEDWSLEASRSLERS
jgi:hypothetical protein